MNWSLKRFCQNAYKYQYNTKIMSFQDYSIDKNLESEISKSSLSFSQEKNHTYFKMENELFEIEYNKNWNTLSVKFKYEQPIVIIGFLEGTQKKYKAYSSEITIINSDEIILCELQREKQDLEELKKYTDNKQINSILELQKEKENNTIYGPEEYFLYADELLEKIIIKTSFNKKYSKLFPEIKKESSFKKFYKYFRS